MFQIDVIKYRLELYHPFTVTHASRTHQNILLIQVKNNGITGWGEASIASYHPIPIEALQAFFETVKPSLENIPFDDPLSFWKKTNPLLKDHPALQCALDIAVYDWFAKKRALPLYRLLDLDIANVPMSSYTIGIAEPEKMLEKMQATPWPIYKIKLGTSKDLDLIKYLRSYTNATFRIDANTGWDALQTIELSSALKKLGVEYIEQPMPADNWEAMEEVRQKSALPIIADESCQAAEDVKQCAPYFHGINIKLMKCGGISPALTMIKEARELKLKVMLGCMLESSVGISGASQLLPLVDYADLDSILLIRNDAASGVELKEGRFIFPDRNGIGVNIKI